MEDTLRESSGRRSKKLLSLNPCFNGRYSQSMEKKNVIESLIVLILVLMEDTLREQRLMFLCIRVFGVCSSF